MRFALVPTVLVFVSGVVVGHFATRWIGVGEPIEESARGGSERAAAAKGVSSGGRALELENSPGLQPIGGAEFLVLVEASGDREGFHGQIAVLAEIEERIATSDFNDLAQAVVSAPAGSNREAALRTLISAHAGKNPEAVLAFVGTLEMGREREMAVRTLFSTVARTDPSKAIQLASTVPDSEERASALGAAVSAWATRDAIAALAYVGGNADERMRPALYRDIAMRTRSNHRQVFEAVVSNVPAGSLFEQSIFGVFANWSRENPQDAAAALAELPSGPVSRSAALLVARQWAGTATDKKPVLEWARGLSEGDVRNQAMGRVFENWGRSDAVAAVLEFDRLPPEQRKATVGALAAGWGRRDPESALQWAERISDSDQKDRAVQAVVGAWAKMRPEEAAQRVASMTPAQRPGAITELIKGWSSKNAEAAAEWLLSQPIGTDRDGAVVVLSNRIAREDPETGFSLAEGISNADKRSAALGQIGREWMRSDPAAARQWISKSNLPESVRSELLK
jgi:hypothetical protein